ncbi:START-like domain protein [Raphanus sativus]|nr:START-like domain protein [Raphanus sativus]
MSFRQVLLFIGVGLFLRMLLQTLLGISSGTMSFDLKWDHMLAYFKTLEEDLQTGTTIVHWIKKFPIFCSDREYIIGRRIWESGKKYYAVTEGVPYPTLPNVEWSFISQAGLSKQICQSAQMAGVITKPNMDLVETSICRGGRREGTSHGEGKETKGAVQCRLEMGRCRRSCFGLWASFKCYRQGLNGWSRAETCS